MRGPLSREVLHAAVRRDLQAVGRDELERGLDPARDRVCGLRLVVREVEHTEDDRLRLDVAEDRQVQVGLGRLDKTAALRGRGVERERLERLVAGARL